MSIKPRIKVPSLSLPTVGGGQFELAQSAPKTFALLVVYRGLHCPICKTYLRDLDRKLGEFEALGVMAIAVSTDTQERAEQSKGCRRDLCGNWLSGVSPAGDSWVD